MGSKAPGTGNGSLAGGAMRLTRQHARRYLPILDWGRTYDRGTLSNDLIAAVIVTLMLIPQSLAYALLAGLPPVVGLYASILPLIAYAIFGTSRTLSVGPVAVVSLMTAAVAGKVAAGGTVEYLAATIALAAISGLMLTAMGLLRLGFLANLLSHPVVSGFITASGIIIAASQLKHLLGVKAEGETLVEIVLSLASRIGDTNLVTLAIGVGATAFLVWVRKGLKPTLMKLGLKEGPAGVATKAGPVLAIVVTTAAVALLGLDERGVRTVGDIPVGLPPFALPSFDAGLWSELLVGAAFISIIGFVESVSVAQTLAAKRRQRIDPDQELVALGSSNLASSLSGGFPVTGGFSRSVVNFDAGAATPAAGAFTAIGIALATVFLTPLLFYLPLATLSATIIVAVLTLVDLHKPVELWRYSKRDFIAITATILVTLVDGVETGVLVGVIASLALFVWHSSLPHAAVVGQVPNTEHFRNVRRHKVLCDPQVLTIRVDESLTYLNSRWLEEFVLSEIADNPEVKHLVLMCSAVNFIDASGLEVLEALNERLGDAGVTMHLSEVKGPVTDRLSRTHFLYKLSGKIFLTQYDAFRTLAPDAAAHGTMSTPDLGANRIEKRM
ncbi:SulP family inorganic anion transporter [Qipengyuania gaetbuli]|uniref:SulP family inorganic anion transporter n=1 Tax=Qipengyuania gaetbuli TaxID=266952 RepID=UPI001CD38E22|nr:sulfate permease [Qipengyuania gaetbuli]MCA0909118.1 sulfate permease [Qipengyuania gaetbuli]